MMDEVRESDSTLIAEREQRFADDMRAIRRQEGVRRFDPERDPISPTELAKTLELTLSHSPVRLKDWKVESVYEALGMKEEAVKNREQYRAELALIRARRKRGTILEGEADELMNVAFREYMMPETRIAEFLDEGVTVVAGSARAEGNQRSWTALTVIKKPEENLFVLVNARRTDFPAVNYDVLNRKQLQELLKLTRDVYFSGAETASDVLNEAMSRYGHRYQIEVGYYPDEYDIAQKIVDAFTQSTK